MSAPTAPISTPETAETAARVFQQELVTPAAPPPTGDTSAALPVPPDAEPEAYFKDDDYENPDGLSCTHCGGEAYREVDDIFWDDCDEYGWGPCTSCRGTGLRRYQWVF